MSTTHDDNHDESERITLHESSHAPAPITDEANADDVRIDNLDEERQEQERTPLLSRSYSQDSVITTESAPPPYELYPPAKTIFGRAYNWLRQIPRLRSHQAIALPTLHLRRSRYSSSLSSSSIDSIASSAYPPPCCYSHSLPRVVLPSPLARLRGLLLCISFFALVLFSFLLFCSIFFAPASLGPPVLPDKSTNTSARFLTLNVFLRPPGVTNNWSDYKDERLQYLVRYVLPQYDVVAFQEAFAFASRRKDRLIQQARKMGYNYHVESPRHFPWDFAADGGLLILSRFPIRQADTIEYPRGIHSDWLAYKGAIHALIELNGTHSLHLYTTHTQASYEQGGNQADVQIRLSQLARLHDLIRDTAKDDDLPILVIGDLNVDAAVHDDILEPSKESSQEYRMMMDVLSGHGVSSEEYNYYQDNEDELNRRLYADKWQIDNLTDVVYEHYGYHPVTFGDVVKGADGELEPAETVLTNEEQVMTVQSIDRILWAARSRRSFLSINNVQVEKFLVRDNDRLDPNDIPFTQVSDHYGLSCTVDLM